MLYRRHKKVLADTSSLNAADEELVRQIAANELVRQIVEHVAQQESLCSPPGSLSGGAPKRENDEHDEGPPGVAAAEETLQEYLAFVSEHRRAPLYRDKGDEGRLHRRYYKVRTAGEYEQLCNDIDDALEQAKKSSSVSECLPEYLALSKRIYDHPQNTKEYVTFLFVF